MIRNPFNLLLLALSGISLATGDLEATLIISAMVLLSVSLRFVQELRSTVSAEKLRAMVKVTATVARPVAGQPFIETPIERLVPGDIVRLSAGDMVPADVRLISSKDLFISQAVLTGDALPVEKHAKVMESETSNPLEAPARPAR